MKKNHKRINAAVLSIALGFSAVGAATLAPAAGAQISANQASTVDANANVSLTIEKYQGMPTSDLTGVPTIAGIEFRVQKVSADLTTTG